MILVVLALLFVVSQSKASLLDTTNNKALFELQRYKEVITADYVDNVLSRASLVNLNTNINSWYILNLLDKKYSETNLNIFPVDDSLKLRLNTTSPELVISNSSSTIYICNIEEEIYHAYKSKKRTRFGYISICNDLLFISVKQDGFRSMIERGAEVFRWLGGDAGEKVISQVKEHFFLDRYVVNEQTEELEETSGVNEGTTALPRAYVAGRYQHTTIPAHHLGLKTQNSERTLLAGQWYQLKNFPEVYTSMIMPGMVSREIQASHRNRVNRLDSVERTAVVNLMAINLNKYTLGWGHGTHHPGVGWSPRARNIKRDNPYGPDGFNRMEPFIPFGHVPPFHWKKTIGTFSGGFQGRHSAFKYGELSTKNKAHHYGFMEKGVLLSTPTEGLATVIIYKDGRVELKRWEAQDRKKLPFIRHIRQNGVPLIHRGENGEGVPGKWVKYWGPGNWSGTVDKQLRAPRGGACLIETHQGDYLVYAFFSGATPSAMARVFQAYGCSFAIQLDLNSPGQAYGSLFTSKGEDGAIDIELLMTNMHAYMGGNKATPRFFIKPDYKDFFYIMKRE